MMPYNGDDYHGRLPFHHPNYHSQHRYSGAPQFGPREVELSKSDEDDLELMWSEGRPPWRPIDTFLRRALMAGGCLLIYATLIAAVLFVIDISIPDPAPSPARTSLLNTDQPLFTQGK